MIPAGTLVVPLEYATGWFGLDRAERLRAAAVPMPAVSALDALATWADQNNAEVEVWRNDGKGRADELWGAHAYREGADGYYEAFYGPTAEDAARRLHTTLNERHQT